MRKNCRGVSIYARNRKSIRLKNYDYSSSGGYFITICTYNRKHLFGKIIDGKMILNDGGKIAQQYWLEIPKHFPNAGLDEFIIMPNHVHGIIMIHNHVRANDYSPAKFKSPSKTIGSIIRGFKIAVTKWFRFNSNVYIVWQRNYYEHIIRNENELNKIREYIVNNPLQWQYDRENPRRANDYSPYRIHIMNWRKISMAKNNNRRITSPQSLNAYIKSICDIMRRSGRAGALQYVPELTWMLFLKILDERESREEEEAKALGIPFRPSLEYPYRWRDWASATGKKRFELQMGTLGGFMSFVNGELIPYLRNLKNMPGATPRQKVISEVFSSTERTYIDTERNLLDILDKINELSISNVDETHMFTLSQVYEGLLLKMGEKNNDGGQFFTPREIIRVMVKVIDPKIGETVYDPCCGTGGFLAQAYQHMKEKAKTASDIEILKTKTFYGREKENLVYPIALANLVLQEIDEPHIWHGNTLTGLEFYGGLFQGAPALFDVILTNPPFGGKEGKDAQTQFAYKTSSTQVLFLQHVIDSLKTGGRCGIVMDEGVLFRTNENAFVQTKRKLLNECDLWCIVSLPPKVFVNAGAASKTNLLFFTKGKPTEEIWYYDLSDINVTKKQPLTLQHFEEFFKLLPERAISERSWRVKREEIEARNYDLKAVNPNRKEKEDTRTPQELISIIESETMRIKEILERLKNIGT